MQNILSISIEFFNFKNKWKKYLKLKIKTNCEKFIENFKNPKLLRNSKIFVEMFKKEDEKEFQQNQKNNMKMLKQSGESNKKKNFIPLNTLKFKNIFVLLVFSSFLFI